jgi:hypothetical protein
MLTITRITTETFIETEEPGALCDIRVKLDEPLQLPVSPQRPDGERVEVTSFRVSLNRDLDEAWPLAAASSYLKAGGYELTKKGTRNKTSGYSPYLNLVLDDALLATWLTEVDRLLVVARLR